MSVAATATVGFAIIAFVMTLFLPHSPIFHPQLTTALALNLPKKSTLNNPPLLLPNHSRNRMDGWGIWFTFPHTWTSSLTSGGPALPVYSLPLLLPPHRAFVDPPIMLYIGAPPIVLSLYSSLSPAFHVI